VLQKGLTRSRNSEDGRIGKKKKNDKRTGLENTKQKK
jgi:hypothetical protein